MGIRKILDSIGFMHNFSIFRIGNKLLSCQKIEGPIDREAIRLII